MGAALSIHTCCACGAHGANFRSLLPHLLVSNTAAAPVRMSDKLDTQSRSLLGAMPSVMGSHATTSATLPGAVCAPRGAISQLYCRLLITTGRSWACGGGEHCADNRPPPLA